MSTKLKASGPISKLRLFLLSVLVTAGAVLGLMFLNRPKPPADLKLVQISEDVFLTSQLKATHVRGLRRFHDIGTIVDMRPDGEASDQAPFSEIQSSARMNRINSHYIPVPHEGIPDTAVAELTEVLSNEPSPVLLYCRTGRRAVKTYALATASQIGGPNLDHILKMVSDAGFSAEDLKSDIASRIAARNPSTSQRQSAETTVR